MTLLAEVAPVFPLNGPIFTLVDSAHLRLVSIGSELK
jgi:hypothetical protein